MTDAAELVKLAACPFCGGTDLVTRGDNAIGCKNLSCEAYIDIGHSVGAEARAHVAARWNRRAAQQDGAEVEALKHDIERHLAITSEQAAEIERLRAEVGMLHDDAEVARRRT